MTEAFGSDGFSLTGVVATTVGNEVTCVTNSIRCCAEVALAACPTQKRRNSRLTLGAAAGLIKTRVVEPTTVCAAAEMENSRMSMAPYRCDITANNDRSIRTAP